MATNPNITKKQISDAEGWLLTIIAMGEENGFSSMVELFTPARAFVLLQNNPDNRNIRPRKVAQYKRDMLSSEWKENGEAIIISKDGLLNGGQHRLTALMETGKEYRMALSYGVDRDSRLTTDLGAAKSAGDHLSSQGVANANVAAAAGRTILAFRMDKTSSNISIPEVQRFVSDNELLAETTSWASAHGAKFRPFKMTGSAISAIYYILRDAQPKFATKFMEAFRDGEYLKAESGPYLLRNRLMIGLKLTPRDKMELIVRAFNLWIRDESQSKLQLTGVIPNILGPKKGEADNG